MATTPDRVRYAKNLLFSRSLTAADTTVPSVDTGADVVDWDQVLVVVAGDATGALDLFIFKQWALFYAANDVDKMVPGDFFEDVPIYVSAPFAGSTRGVSVFIVATQGCDRIFPTVSLLSGAANVYITVFGVTPAGAQLLATSSSSGGAGGGGDVNIEEIGATAVVTGGVNGTLGVGGLAAHGAAVAGNPVLVGAKATAAEPATVHEGDVADLSVTLTGRSRVDAIGNVAHDAADAGAPVKIGFKAVSTLPANVSATLDRADGISDLKGIQYVRDGIAGDSVAAANRVSSNTIADDRDEAAQPWLSVTDDATDPDYGPSSAGQEVGNRTWFSFELSIRDGVVTFEESELGTIWVDTTRMVVDRATGAGGYASFSEPDAATVTFKLELTTGARYVRLKWNPNNATSIIVASCTARAAA